MAKDIELQPEQYEIIPEEPKSLDEPKKGKFYFEAGNSSTKNMLFIGIGALALLLLLKKK